jgi:hypothetical protein
MIAARVILVLSLLTSLAASAAANRDDDDGPQPSLLATDRTKARAYPGGHDEQDLTVQATLPQPTRALDAATKDPLLTPDGDEPAQPEEGASHD